MVITQVVDLDTAVSASISKQTQASSYIYPLTFFHFKGRGTWKNKKS